MRAWHFIKDDLKLLDGNTVAAGYVYEVEPPIDLCRWGLHASKRPVDALKYAPGLVICRVELSGEILHDTDKSVATRREVLWMADASKQVKLWACWCCRKIWDLMTDERSRQAVIAAEKYLAGEISLDEINAAGDAAGYAAGYAAGDAAWTAARDARYAAWDAQNKQLTKMLMELKP